MYAKIHYSPPKGGAFAPPLPPLNPPLAISQIIFKQNTLAYYCKYLQCTVSKTRKYLATVQCLLSFSIGGSRIFERGFQYAIKARVGGSGGMPPQENFMIFEIVSGVLLE